MTNFVQSLKDFKEQGKLWRLASADHSELIAQVESELKASLLELQRKVGEVKLGTPLLDPQVVWQHFLHHGQKLAALEPVHIRTLLRDSDIATSPEFLEALKSQPDVLFRSLNLLYLGICYFARWRTAKQVDLLEALMKTAMSRSPSKHPLLQRWKKAPALFSRNADSFLSGRVKPPKIDTEAVLKDFNVPVASELGMEVAGKVLLDAVSSFLDKEKDKPDSWCRTQVEYIWKSLATGFVAQPVLASAAESFLLSRSPEADTRLRDFLKSEIIANDRLGDPRVSTTAGNWTGIKIAAKERLISWLADGHLRFFFEEVLPKHDKNSARKDFWLKYVGKVINFQVALSEDHRTRIARLPNKPKDLRFIHLEDPTVSAFIMKFRGHYNQEYIVIEFSEIGNAAYIYRAKDFEAKGLSLMSQRPLKRSELKFDDTHRIIHKHPWEFKESQRLSRDFGIVP